MLGEYFSSSFLSRNINGEHDTDDDLEYMADFMGECNHETAFEILDYFYESGGNFIDTSNAYQVLTMRLSIP